MKVGKTRELLIEEIQKKIPLLVQHDSILEEVSMQLHQHHMSIGHILALINDKNNLNEANLQELLLLGEQLHLKFADSEANWLAEWLNPSEVKELRMYIKESPYEETITLPYTFENVLQVGRNEYVAVIPNSMIGKLWMSGITMYNPNIQRQAKKKKVKNGIIEVMNLNPKSLQAIEKQALEGDLITSTLRYNAKVGSGADGIELDYNEREQTLTLLAGTLVDILDGAHRTFSLYNAYMKKVDLAGSMIVIFSNMTEAQCKRVQVDMAKANPIPKPRLQELAKNKLSDEVVIELKAEGELKGRITSNSIIKYSYGEVITFSELSNAIENSFHLENRLAVIKVAKVINDYMMYVFAYYKPNLFDKHSLMFKSRMFIGHIELAALMFEHHIPFENVHKYLDKIDFAIDNPIWEEVGILKYGSISARNRAKIQQMFQQLI
ncbi:hypothetical protein I6G82_11355 [Lysinibacillus macroides]|uniref:SPBc2 prophage-derived protein YopQ n=1 Tax=Lysinibacillus macroides TaxID=33935 RepID=A0A0M9DLU2_9BACI|nr:hypothetical protein [Lysinibacillus macroides]KOY83030.1 hypothetical protein ADM90_06900 [Lysinibacillus macroides]QPR70117.1 hypothetical protein I6G82_11355 [Lysinibacillus macroides]